MNAPCEGVTDASENGFQVCEWSFELRRMQQPHSEKPFSRKFSLMFDRPVDCPCVQVSISAKDCRQIVGLVFKDPPPLSILHTWRMFLPALLHNGHLVKSSPPRNEIVWSDVLPAVRTSLHVQIKGATCEKR